MTEKFEKAIKVLQATASVLLAFAGCIGSLKMLCEQLENQNNKGDEA